MRKDTGKECWELTPGMQEAEDRLSHGAVQGRRAAARRGVVRHSAVQDL